MRGGALSLCPVRAEEQQGHLAGGGGPHGGAENVLLLCPDGAS